MRAPTPGQSQMPWRWPRFGSCGELVGDQWLLTMHRRTPNVMGGVPVLAHQAMNSREDVKFRLSSHVRESLSAWTDRRSGRRRIGGPTP